MKNLLNRRASVVLGAALGLSLAGCASLSDALKDLNTTEPAPPPASAPSYRKVQDTPLAGLFVGHEDQAWPRVALTVVHVPRPDRWTSSDPSNPATHPELTVGYPGDDACFLVGARIWRMATAHEDVAPFYFCPQDVVRNVPFMGLDYVGPSAGETTTGTMRTLGPTPSRTLFPDDPDTMRAFGRDDTLPRSREYLVGSLMIAMHYDWNTERHLRVWVANYTEAHSSYFRDR